MPRRPDARSSAEKVMLSIKRQLEFSSQTLRSGVVVISTDAPKGSALLFLRGAPAVIKSLVTPTSVPPDFDQVRLRHLPSVETCFYSPQACLCLCSHSEMFLTIVFMFPKEPFPLLPSLAAAAALFRTALYRSRKSSRCCLLPLRKQTLIMPLSRNC